MTPPSHRANVLRAYRELLGLIRRLPDAAQRQQSWREAREAVRRHAGEPNPVAASDYLKEMVTRISFLRVVTPRVAGDASRTGAGHWVMRDGQLVEGYGDTGGSR